MRPAGPGDDCRALLALAVAIAGVELAEGPEATWEALQAVIAGRAAVKPRH